MRSANSCGKPLGRILAGGLLALVVFGLLSVIPVSAHAVLSRAIPAPGSVLSQSPASVTIWFTEAVDPSYSAIKVLDDKGNQVDNGDSARYQNDPTALTVTLPSLPDGLYTVAWHNVSSVDGHSISGSYVFYVGTYTGGPLQVATGAGPILQSPAEPVFRWIELLSILAIVGSLVFELFITRPVIMANAANQAWQLMAQRMGFRTLKLVLFTGGTFLLSSAGELVVKTAVAYSIPWYEAIGHAHAFAAQTGWGHLWGWRMGLMIALLVLVAVVYPRQAGRRVALWRDWRTPSLVLAAGVLLMLSLASHGAALTQLQAAGTFSDYLHLLAASIWVGGILYLALVAPPAMKLFRQGMQAAGSSEAVSTPDRPAAPAFCPSSHLIALNRFAALAIMSVGVLIVTGLWSTWAQVTVLPALATPYGETLSIKLALMVPLLALGAVNFFWVIPRLTRDGKALKVLYRTVSAQAVLTVMVLLSVAFLLSMDPARQAAPLLGIGQTQGITLKQKVDWAQITIAIEPGSIGSNQFIVTLRDSSGKAVSNATYVGLFITYLNGDLGPYWQYAVSAGNGEYTLDSSLSVAGPWQVEIHVSVPGQFDVDTTLKFQVLSQGTVAFVPIPLSVGTGYVLWGVEMVLIGLLFIPVLRVARRFK